MSRALVLEDGESRALVYPEHGFQLHSFEVGLGKRPVELIYGPPGGREPADRRYGNPILFPSVGASYGSQADHWDREGRALLMPQHGWARDLFWHLESSDTRSVTAVLIPHGAMRLAFPFPLEVRARYALEGSALTLSVTVSNLGAERFPFALGFHPYLRAPLFGKSTRDACIVRLPSGVRSQSTDGWRTLERSPTPSRLIAASDPELQGTVILGETGTRALEVEDTTSGMAVGVSVEQGAELLPIWAIWSAAPDAAYVCLEPWSDVPNALNRPGTRTLSPGEKIGVKLRIGMRPL